MTTPFKCIVDYMGGVSHEKDFQDATRFTLSGEEFRLVPRTNLPSQHLSMFDQVGLNQPTISELEGGVIESNTYFLRQAKANPLKLKSWVACNLTTHVGFFGYEQIICGQEVNYPKHLFRMNLNTKKFVAVYLGSWDAPPHKEGYYGDSSVFSFGQCRPYYD